MALTLSNFVPTARFGYMMTSLLGAALIGDLILLPCLLALRPQQAVEDEDTDRNDSNDLLEKQLPHAPQFLNQNRRGTKDQSEKAVA